MKKMFRTMLQNCTELNQFCKHLWTANNHCYECCCVELVGYQARNFWVLMLCIQTPNKSEAILDCQLVCHFVDEMTRDISPRVGR